MSWNKLLNTIKEEINESVPIIKKKPKEKILFEKIAHEVLDDRLDEVDLKAAGERVAGAAKEVGKVVRRGWERLKGKIKEVAMFGFRFGAGLAKTVSNKFVLFNKKGEILTPEADKVSFEELSKGKKFLTMTYKTPKFTIPLHLDDKLSICVGSAIIEGGSAGFMYVGQFSKPTVQEGVDYELDLLAEQVDPEEEIHKMRQIVMKGFENPEARQALVDTSKKPIKAREVEIGQAEFTNILERLMKRVASGRTLSGGNIHTMGIYAPSGWGKTLIVGNLSKRNDFNTMRLELDKLPVELLTGFPYLADIEDASNETKEDRIRIARKVVKMAESSFLPPHRAQGNWMLFFDEFNRADTERMAAVMNLLMTGELGGVAAARGKKGEVEQYKLPDSIVVMIAMNTQTEANLESAMHEVKALDIATLGRIPKIYFGKLDLPEYSHTFVSKAWVADDKKKNKYVMDSRIAPILMNYMIYMATEKGGLDPKAPFSHVIKVAQKVGKAEGGGGEKLTSPRTWTQVTDEMAEEAIHRWGDMSDEEKGKYKSEAEDLKKDLAGKEGTAIDTKGRTIKKLPEELEPYLFGAWWRDARNQSELCAEQSAAFGDDGKEFVDGMIREYRKIAQRGISDEEIILNYKPRREFVTKNFSKLGFGTEAQLLARIFLVLKGFKNTSAVKRLMRKRGWAVHPSGVITQIYQSIKAMYDDLKFNEDDFVGFAHLIEDKAKEGHEVLRLLHAKMAGKWDSYMESLKKKLKTKSMVEKELEAIAAAGKKGKKKEEPEEAKEEIINFLKTLKELQE